MNNTKIIKRVCIVILISVFIMAAYRGYNKTKVFNDTYQTTKRIIKDSDFNTDTAYIDTDNLRDAIQVASDSTASAIKNFFKKVDEADNKED